MIDIIKYKKEKNGMYTLFLSNNTKIKIHEDLILKYNLLINKKIDDILLLKLLDENKIYEAYELSISLINKKLRNKNEIKKFLLKKEYSDKIIIEVINLLYKNNYLNDLLYIESFIHDKINLSLDGPIKIRKVLLDYGYDIDLIDNILKQYNDNIQIDKINKIINKYIKNNKSYGEKIIKQKIKQELVNLGYNLNLINSCIINLNIDTSDIYNKEYQKIYNKLKNKYSGKKLEYMVKSKLYQKGFNINDF